MYLVVCIVLAVGVEMAAELAGKYGLSKRIILITTNDRCVSNNGLPQPQLIAHWPKFA